MTVEEMRRRAADSFLRTLELGNEVAVRGEEMDTRILAVKMQHGFIESLRATLYSMGAEICERLERRDGS